MATHRILAWKIHGQKSLVGYSPWAYKESDTTEHMHARVCTHTHTQTLLFPFYERGKLNTWRLRGLLLSQVIQRVNSVSHIGAQGCFPV